MTTGGVMAHGSRLAKSVVVVDGASREGNVDDNRAFLAEHLAAVGGSGSSVVSIRFGFVHDSAGRPSLVPVAFVDAIEKWRRIELDDQLWLDLPPTWKFQIYGEMLVTKFCGEGNVQRLVDFAKKSKSESLLEMAALRHIQAKAIGAAERRAVAEVLASLIEWPQRGISWLQDLFAAKSSEDGVLPTARSLRYAATIISASLLPPTDVALCGEGGVGIAWGAAGEHADVEVLNDGDVTFSYRVRGQRPEFVSVSMEEGESLRIALQRVAALHRR